MLLFKLGLKFPVLIPWISPYVNREESGIDTEMSNCYQFMKKRVAVHIQDEMLIRENSASGNPAWVDFHRKLSTEPQLIMDHSDPKLQIPHT